MTTNRIAKYYALADRYTLPELHLPLMESRPVVVILELRRSDCVRGHVISQTVDWLGCLGSAGAWCRMQTEAAMNIDEPGKWVVRVLHVREGE